jgi:hypothetical protein
LVESHPLATRLLAWLGSLPVGFGEDLLARLCPNERVEQVRTIGRAIGRDLRWVEQPREEALRALTDAFRDRAFAEAALTGWAGFVERPELVNDTIETITGRPARSYAEWAADHADRFR